MGPNKAVGVLNIDKHAQHRYNLNEINTRNKITLQRIRTKEWQQLKCALKESIHVMITLARPNIKKGLN